MKESDLEGDILVAMKRMGVLCWRTHDAKHRPCEQGVSDIVGCRKGGQMVAVEVKSDGGRVSPLQLDFLDRLRYMGALTCVARTVDDVLEALR